METLLTNIRETERYSNPTEDPEQMVLNGGSIFTGISVETNPDYNPTENSRQMVAEDPEQMVLNGGSIFTGISVETNPNYNPTENSGKNPMNKKGKSISTGRPKSEPSTILIKPKGIRYIVKLFRSWDRLIRNLRREARRREKAQSRDRGSRLPSHHQGNPSGRRR